MIKIKIQQYVDGKKRCCACKQYLSVGAFGKNKNSLDGLATNCTNCRHLWYNINREKMKIRSREWRKTHLGYQKTVGLKYKYNLTADEYQNLLTKQNGVCAVCKVLLVGLNSRQTNVDHNHVTGKVRELLCSRCNIGLAYIEDNDFHLKAVAYLKKHK